MRKATEHPQGCHSANHEQPLAPQGGDAFESDANAKIHQNTTAQEILADFAGDRLDYWVTGYGTGGTFAGVSAVLREQRPETQIVLSEPINAQLIDSGQPQQRADDGSPAASHPAFEPHLIQGWTPDFIPKVLQSSIDDNRFDHLTPVDSQEGITAAKMLAQQEGIFTGISGGCTFAVALQLAKTAEPGSVILCMLPDTGERYLSSALFADIDDDMNDDEIALSLSTPGYHLDE